MRKYLIGVATLPLLSAVAFAGQPLSDRQMDAVTAGFGAIATAGAMSQGGVIQAGTQTLAEVAVYGTLVFQERSINIIKAVSASASQSSAASLPANQVVPGVSLPAAGTGG